MKRKYVFIRDRWQVASASYECEGCGFIIRRGERFYILLRKVRRFVMRRFCAECGASMNKRDTQHTFDFTPDA